MTPLPSSRQSVMVALSITLGAAITVAYIMHHTFPRFSVPDHTAAHGPIEVAMQAVY
jgi:hypothetical protein